MINILVGSQGLLGTLNILNLQGFERGMLARLISAIVLTVSQYTDLPGLLRDVGTGFRELFRTSLEVALFAL